jgi:hypothetical protein
VLPQEGSRECRAPDAPAALRAKVESTQASHHGHAGSPGIPRAMVLTAYFALSPVTELSCHRRPRSEFRELDASVGASGPHDFAVRKISAFVNAPPASTASRPAFVTIANRPSRWDETAQESEVICVKRKRKYFCKRGWTGVSRHQPIAGRSPSCQRACHNMWRRGRYCPCSPQRAPATSKRC